MALQAAHQGYVFQDLATAYFLVQAIIHRYESLVVDKKIATPDKFDDLTFTKSSNRHRFQFKGHKVGTERKLTLNDFKEGDLRLSDLVETYNLSGAENYRICVTWHAPDDGLLSLLEPVVNSSSFAGISTKTFRIKIDEIWSPGGSPIWTNLTSTKFNRDDLARFLQNLIIECEIPQASLLLDKPGKLEELLIASLEEKVGIGRYPNDSDPVHFADRVIHLATLSRATGRTFTSAEVIHELGINTDFGRIDQQSPVVERKFIYRDNFQKTLRTLKEKAVIVLTGSPGAGKSWALSKVANDLNRDNTIAAIHYCYLHPGDKDIQKRITSNVLFGNLISEILTIDPSLEDEKESRFSADLKELELLLRAASKKGKRVCLIVDGIDHISRVFSESRSLALGEIDIVEKLSAIELPENCYLIIGSQPGNHLNPILTRSDCISFEVPKWNVTDIKNLIEKFSINEESEEKQNEVIKKLTDKSEGNPLYATFLTRSIQELVTSNPEADICSFLDQNPEINGEIANYYEHLYQTLTDRGVDLNISEALGLVDFSLNADELKAIFPARQHKVDETLQILAPILLHTTSNSGIKIYHESFRRFILNKIKLQNGSIPDILQPIVSCLKTKDFYFDTKAYRFLPSLLYRSSLNREVIDLIDPNFVIKSLEAGRSRTEIDENIQLAVEIATEEKSWEFLTRIAEFTRAIHTCFEEKLLDIADFNKTFGLIYGYDTLAERLTFDGLPTYSAGTGLLLCSLCDDNGITPPWSEYLRLPLSKDGQKTSLARIHGRLRVDGVKPVIKRIKEWLRQFTDDVPPKNYLEDLLKRVCQFGGTEIYQRFLEDKKITKEVKDYIRFFYIKALLNEDPQKAARMLRKIRLDEIPEDDLLFYLSKGSIDSSVLKLPDLAAFDISLSGSPQSPRKENIGPWVKAVNLMAYIKPELLDVELLRVTGTGWYRKWLAYVIDVAKLKADPREIAEKQREITTVIDNVATDLQPFQGDPRACDLFDIEGLIHESFNDLLKLVQHEEVWKVVIDKLEEISDKLTTSLQGSPGGPLTSEAFIDLLLPYTNKKKISDLIVKKIELQEKGARNMGEFYEIQAAHEVTLAKALNEVSEIQEAKDHWRLACQFYCSYGFRKDVTIYELLGGLTAISSLSKEKAEELLTRVQPLVNNTVIHTDGRETRHAPVYWFTILCKTNLVKAFRLLARSLADETGGSIDWRLESNLQEILSASKNEIDPAIWLSINYTLPFISDDLRDDKHRLKDSLEVISEHEQKYGKEATVVHFQRTATHILEDSTKHNKDLIALLNQYSADHDYPQINKQVIISEDGASSSNANNLPPDRKSGYSFSEPLALDVNPHKLLKILSNYRQAVIVNGGFVNRFGYKLLELSANGEERFAYSLIKAVHQRIYYKEGEVEALLELAEGLNQHGLNNLAVYVLSLVDKSKNGKEGLSFDGTTKDFKEIDKARLLSSDMTDEAVFKDISDYIKGGSYIYGITTYLIDYFVHIGDLSLAVAIWESAYDVINLRLSSPQENHGVIQPLSSLTEPVNANSGAIELLFARVSHPEFRRKRAALSGIGTLIDLFPQDTANAFKEICKYDTLCSSMVSILMLILQLDQFPREFVSHILEQLTPLSRANHFGLKYLATKIIEKFEYSDDTNDAITYGIPHRAKREEKVGQVWPEFSSLVNARAKGLADQSKVLKRRMRNQMEATHDRAYKTEPVQILYWIDEYYELGIYDVALGFNSALWKQARQFDYQEDWLAQILLPNIKLLITYDNSRILRPVDLPKPDEINTGIFDVKTTEAPEEWVRIASYEESYVFNEQGFHDVKSKLTVASGLTNESSFDFDYLPYGKADYHHWFSAIDGTNQMDLTRFTGPVIGFDLVNDINGLFPTLVLHERIRDRLKLSSPKVPGPLTLYDEDGDLAVIFRQWWTHSFRDGFSLQVPLIEGCDLIVRSDVFNKINRLFSNNLKIVYVVNSKDLRIK